jgi:hypothetical protein
LRYTGDRAQRFEERQQREQKKREAIAVAVKRAAAVTTPMHLQFLLF